MPEWLSICLATYAAGVVLIVFVYGITMPPEARVRHSATGTSRPHHHRRPALAARNTVLHHLWYLPAYPDSEDRGMTEHELTVKEFFDRLSEELDRLSKEKENNNDVR